MVASIGRNRALAGWPAAGCVLSSIIVAIKPMPYTNELKFDDTSIMKKVNNVSHPQSPHWVNMRWQPDLTATYVAADDDDSTNCIPNFRLANATIHCGINTMSPPPISVTADGTQYCGGVTMEPRYCLLPTSGRWTDDTATGPFIVEDHQHSRRFGIHRYYYNDTSLLRKTMQNNGGIY